MFCLRSAIKFDDLEITKLSGLSMKYTYWCIQRYSVSLSVFEMRMKLLSFGTLKIIPYSNEFFRIDWKLLFILMSSLEYLGQSHIFLTFEWWREIWIISFHYSLHLSPSFLSLLISLSLIYCHKIIL
jgi:hypothetical protein